MAAAHSAGGAAIAVECCPLNTSSHAAVETGGTASTSAALVWFLFGATDTGNEISKGCSAKTENMELKTISVHRAAKACNPSGLVLIIRETNYKNSK